MEELYPKQGEQAFLSEDKDKDQAEDQIPKTFGHEFKSRILEKLGGNGPEMKVLGRSLKRIRRIGSMLVLLTAHPLLLLLFCFLS